MWIIGDFGSGVVRSGFGELATDEVENGFEDVVAQGVRIVGGEGQHVGGNGFFIRTCHPDGHRGRGLGGLDGFSDIEFVGELDLAGRGKAQLLVDVLHDRRQEIGKFFAGADVNDDGLLELGVVVPESEGGTDAADGFEGGLDLFLVGLGEIENALIGEKGTLESALALELRTETQQFHRAVGCPLRVGIEFFGLAEITDLDGFQNFRGIRSRGAFVGG